MMLFAHNRPELVTQKLSNRALSRAVFDCRAFVRRVHGGQV